MFEAAILELTGFVDTPSLDSEVFRMARIKDGPGLDRRLHRAASAERFHIAHCIGVDARSWLSVQVEYDLLVAGIAVAIARCKRASYRNTAGNIFRSRETASGTQESLNCSRKRCILLIINDKFGGERGIHIVSR